MADFSLGKQTVELATKEFGSLDGIVINHGVLDPVERIASWNVDEWKHHFDINFFSAISLVCKTI
jgi:NAD(P)-dependent dehydrogenase (short-subunit alcohol dehydrogenase family)